MARHGRSFQRGVSKLPNYSWNTFLEDSVIVVPADTSTAVIGFVNVAEDLTIVRTHIEFYAFDNSVGTNVVGAVGMSVVNPAAWGGGAALGIPDTVNFPDFNSDAFFAYRNFSYEVPALDGGPRGHIYDIDSKAMRKVPDHYVSVLSLGNANQLAAIQFMFTVRFLTKLRA